MQTVAFAAPPPPYSPTPSLSGVACGWREVHLPWWVTSVQQKVSVDHVERNIRYVAAICASVMNYGRQRVEKWQYKDFWPVWPDSSASVAAGGIFNNSSWQNRRPSSARNVLESKHVFVFVPQNMKNLENWEQFGPVSAVFFFSHYSSDSKTGTERIFSE